MSGSPLTVSLSHLVVSTDTTDTTPSLGRKPAWLKMRMPGGENYAKLLKLVNDNRLHTVCQSAKCPNMGECWSAGTATLMILGDVCTRSCGFCHIATGRPGALDLDEPVRVGRAVAMMKLGHTVITSVNRDELPDGGAAVWAETIRQIRLQSPGTSVEVLIPDFCGNWHALQVVLDERPDILNHNIETVPRLYRRVRPQARELYLLYDAGAVTPIVGFDGDLRNATYLLWDVTSAPDRARRAEGLCCASPRTRGW